MAKYRYAEPRDAAEAGDEAIELAVVQPALEAVAEQRAELLPLRASPSSSHSARRTRLEERSIGERPAPFVAARVREVAAPQHGRRRCLRDRRRVDEPARLARGEERRAVLARRGDGTGVRGDGRRSCTQPKPPSASPRGVCLAELVSRRVASDGDPRVEAVGAEVEAAAQLPLAARPPAASRGEPRLARSSSSAAASGSSAAVSVCSFDRERRVAS